MITPRVSHGLQSVLACQVFIGKGLHGLKTKAHADCRFSQWEHSWTRWAGFGFSNDKSLQYWSMGLLFFFNCWCFHYLWLPRMERAAPPLLFATSPGELQGVGQCCAGSGGAGRQWCSPGTAQRWRWLQGDTSHCVCAALVVRSAATAVSLAATSSASLLRFSKDSVEIILESICRWTQHVPSVWACHDLLTSLYSNCQVTSLFLMSFQLVPFPELFLKDIPQKSALSQCLQM